MAGEEEEKKRPSSSDRGRRREKDKEGSDEVKARQSRKKGTTSRKSRSSSSHASASSNDDDKSVDRHRRRREKQTSKEKSRKSRSRSKRDKRDRKDGHKRSSSKRKRRRRYSSSSSSSRSCSSSSSSSGSNGSDQEAQGGDTNSKKVQKVVNQRLLLKLAERGETLEERDERRAERRAARITAQFGYTSQDNPFNDPNIAETFTWKKKDQVDATKTKSGPGKASGGTNKKKDQHEIIDEIEKVRKRRRDYEESKEEMERIKAEESRMKELENYDEWQKKEEEFHLLQQRQRSAIRLVEGREKPIDVLAKNLLIFGLSEGEKKERDQVKYQEKYDAMDELENLEAELEEPHVFLKDLKLQELEELLSDIHVFRVLEKDVGGYDNGGENTVLIYWDALHLVTRAEIQDMKGASGLKDANGGNSNSELKREIEKMFEGQSKPALEKMKDEVETKVKACIMGGGRPVYDEKDGSLIDMSYWQTVLDALLVHLAKMELSDIHSKMLVCQLEHLEKRKEELAMSKSLSKEGDEADVDNAELEASQAIVPDNVAPDFGNLEEELGLADELDMGESSYVWQEKYRPRKPRYFNRVKTGYDWNKYNQTHYDHDNPPPKTVQGYKFNIFYPDLIDRTKSPRYFLEATKSSEYSIIRFHAGPPYEDIAFKIINREWNKSRNRGFRCTFERGVLSLYFNFKTHWYRK